LGQRSLWQASSQLVQSCEDATLSLGKLSRRYPIAEGQDAWRTAVELKIACLSSVVEYVPLGIENGVLLKAMVDVTADDEGCFRRIEDSARAIVGNLCDLNIRTCLTLHPDCAGSTTELLAFTVDGSLDRRLVVKGPTARRAGLRFLRSVGSPPKVAERAENEQRSNEG